MIILNVDKQKGIGFLYLNRTQVHNALDGEMIDEFRKNLLLLKRDPHVRVVIIASKSDKAFSTGVDLSILNRFENTIKAREFALQLEGLMEDIFDFPGPTISLVNGYALGGGFGIALSTDIIVLSRDAKIGFPAVRIGAVLPAGCTYRLISRVGLGRAKELLLTGRILSGEEAFNLGLGEFLEDSDKLMDRGIEIAEEILKGSDFALSMQKDIANALWKNIVGLMTYQSAENFAFLTTTPDWKQRIEEKLKEMGK